MSNRARRGWVVVLMATAILVGLGGPPASALIMVGRGNNPVSDYNWPQGAVEVANLDSRVGYWEGPPFGGGNWNFQYRGDAAALNKALELFAKVIAPAREVIVEDGPSYCDFLRENDNGRLGDNVLEAKAQTRVDWSLSLWTPESWYQLFNNPMSHFDSNAPGFREPLPPPRLTVYVGGDGGIAWEQVKMPVGVRVIDHRAAAAGVKVEGGALVHGQVFDMITSKPVPNVRITFERTDVAQAKSRLAAAPAGRDRGDAAAALEQAAKPLTADTNGKGVFELAKIHPGSYRITATAPGYAAKVIAYEHFEATRFRDYSGIMLAPFAPIRGTVTDNTGQPVVGVKVRADAVMALDGRGYTLASATETTTDAQGRFEIAGLPRGYTSLWCSAPGFHNAGELFKLYPVPSKEEVALRVGAAGAIRGVVFGIGGKPAGGPGVIVNIEPEGGNKVGSWGGSGQAKADGTYEFTDIPPGKYFIHAQPNPGPAKPEVPPVLVEIKPGVTTEQNLKTTAGGF